MRTYTIQVCPICGGDVRQLAHGACANECRGPDGIIPAMVDLVVVPLNGIIPPPEDKP